MPVQPGAEPYRHDGGSVGVLLCHGLTGSPRALRPWAEHLARAGYSVSLPRLPGHGTTWQEMTLTRWEDWYAEVDRAFRELRGCCERVVVAGLSMGGTLALLLAQRRGRDVTGLVLVNPSVMSLDKRLKLVPLLRYAIPSLPAIGGDIKKPGPSEGAYDRTPLKALYSLTKLWVVARRGLPRVRQPVLIFRSREDHVVEPANTDVIVAGISSAEVEVRDLDDSYHVAVLDNDAPAIFAGSVEFLRRHAGDKAPR
ncbi:MAG: alpha/beta hydrolase [Streptosporangiales bacterium]